MHDFFDTASPLSQEQVEMALVAVKAMRGIFGLSQSELARLSGVSRPTISRLETGNDTAIKPETLFHLIRVAQHLGLEVTGDTNGLALHLSIEGIDRSTCRSAKEAESLRYELSDLNFIIERMRNDWGSDATPKRLAECINRRDEILLHRSEN